MATEQPTAIRAAPETAPVVCVLGPISVVTADGQRVVLSGQQAEVLALLAGTHPAGVRTDVLYEALWGERPSRTAATGLRVVINRLRDRLAHAHPDPIVNEAGHYRLALDSETIDRHHFDALVTAGREQSEAGDHDGAIQAFESALGFWRGDPLQTTGDLWPLSGEQARLEELRAETEERLVDSLMHAGRTDDAVTAASSMMREFELRERRWELLVLALYRAGRQTEALRVYRRAERLLSEDYGLQPGPRLAALELRLLQQDPTLLLAPPGGTTPDVSTRDDTGTSAKAEVRGVGLANLLEAMRRSSAVPAIASPLIGRDAELATLAALVAEHRLVTVIGSAGVGKSRLVTQLAIDQDHGPVLWLDQATRGPDSILEDLASQLGVGGHGGDVVAAVLRALASRPMVLVLDNCDHVLDAIAPIAEVLVQQCATLRVLATSRLSFGSQSEMLFDLAPLDRDSARRLILDRMLGVEHRSLLTDHDLDAVANAVDRIPLALELVAGRLRNRPLAAVLAELTESIDQLSGARRTDQRHIGLNEALEWSTDLLDEGALAVYESLGIMVGSFRPRHLTTILDVPIEQLTEQLDHLVGLSLLASVAIGDLPGYQARQTVTLHARGRLVARGGTDVLAERHARFYAALMAGAAIELRGADEEIAVVSVRASVGQIRAAYRWALDHDLALAEQLAVDLWEFAFLRLDFGLFDLARAVVDRMVASDLEPGPDLLATAAFGCWALGLVDEGLRLLTAAEQRSGAVGVAIPIRALQARANIAGMLGDEQTAQETILGALEQARQDKDRNREADIMVVLAIGLVQAGMHDTAIEFAARSLDKAAASQNASLIAWARYGAGVAHFATDPDLARREFAESRRLARSVANRWVEGMAEFGLVRAHTARGESHAAAQMLVPLVELWRGAGMTSMVVQAGRQAALVLSGAGLDDEARLAVEALVDLGTTPSPLDFDDEAYRALAERHGALPLPPRPTVAPKPAAVDLVAGRIGTLLESLLRPSGQ